MTELLDLLTTAATGIDWEQTTLGAIVSTLLGGVAWALKKAFARQPMSELARRILKNIDNPGDYDLNHRQIAFQGGYVIVPCGRRDEDCIFVTNKDGLPSSADEHLTARERQAILALARTKLAEFSAEKKEERREVALRALRDK